MAVQDLLYRRHVTFDDVLHLTGHKSENATSQMNASVTLHAGRPWEDDAPSIERQVGCGATQALRKVCTSAKKAAFTMNKETCQSERLMKAQFDLCVFFNPCPRVLMSGGW